MKILLSGAGGFIGQALKLRLEQDGHTVVRLKRKGACTVPVAWDLESHDLEQQFDAVIHLAGEPIANGRWTRRKKRAIMESRKYGTLVLSEVLAGMPNKPGHLLCASAIGYYGNRGDEALTEGSAPGMGFLAEVCRCWEEAATPARQAGLRVVHLRFGMVLSPHGGALAAMLPVFKRGLGAPLGSGRQVMSWIGLRDAVEAIAFTLNHSELEGAINIVAPEPVTNRTFIRALCRKVNRWMAPPVPALILRLMVGEMADALLLSSARVMPTKLREAGFAWAVNEIEQLEL